MTASEFSLMTARKRRIIQAVFDRETREMQARSHLKPVPPTGQKRAVPERRANTDYRKREHLTPTEVAKLDRRLFPGALDRSLTGLRCF